MQKLVELHRGEINVASKLNEGTTFTLAFPKLMVAESLTQTAQA